MRAKKIKRQIVFDDRRIFGYIDEIKLDSISSKITEKIHVLIDPFDREYECYLRTIVRLGNIIPEVISFHAEGTTPENTKKILENRGIDTTKPLAYYIFQKK